MNGQITVQSEIGVGTTFIFSFKTKCKLEESKYSALLCYLDNLYLHGVENEQLSDHKTGHLIPRKLNALLADDEEF